MESLESLEEQKKRLVSELESKKKELEEQKAISDLKDEIKTVENVTRMKQNEINGILKKDVKGWSDKLIKFVVKNPIFCLFIAGFVMMSFQGEFLAAGGSLVMAFVIPYVLKQDEWKKKQRAKKPTKPE